MCVRVCVCVCVCVCVLRKLSDVGGHLREWEERQGGGWSGQEQDVIRAWRGVSPWVLGEFSSDLDQSASMFY